MGEQPVKPQPIPFSHKLHGHLGLECQSCHEMPGPGWDMSYPAEAKCMVCHASIKTDSPPIAKLVAFYKDHKPVPWVRVYKIPDYVFFSHKAHLKKPGVSCDVCHGSVTERDVLTKEKPTSMKACVDCHAERGAPVRCNYCHNPNP